MYTHRFVRNQVCRILCGCGEITSITLDGRDISHKYIKEMDAIVFGFDDVAGLRTGSVLEITGETSKTITLEKR